MPNDSPQRRVGLGMTKQEFEGHLEPIVSRAYGYALRLAGNAEDAQDLLQEATLAAYKGKETFHEGTNFKAWFFKVLTHEHYRRIGKKKVDTVTLDDAPEGYLYQQAKQSGIEIPDSSDPAAEVFDRLDGDKVDEALAHLPSEYKDAASLYFISEMSYEEIAEALDIPLGTVRSRLHRARRLLQKALWDVAVSRGLVSGGAHAG